MFFLVLYICKRSGMTYGRTTTQAFTGASNNFEVRSEFSLAGFLFLATRTPTYSFYSSPASSSTVVRYSSQ